MAYRLTFRDTIRKNHMLLRISLLTIEVIFCLFLFAQTLVSDTVDAPPPDDNTTIPSVTTSGSSISTTTAPTADTTTESTLSTTLDPGQYQGAKLVALTFDDGPHAKLTPELLDILAREQVSATFFLLGTNIERYPDLVRRQAAEGHQVASHTFAHKKLTSLSPENLSEEIHSTEVLLTDILGYGPSLMRPPYGAFNDKVKAEAAMPLIMWSVDPEDWKDPPVDTLCDRLYDRIRDGDIVLLHDIHKNSIAATEQLIPRLKADGYLFVTVDQLISLRGTEPQEVYFSLR